MVDRCNGKEALVLFTEHENGFHQQYTQEELDYLRKQMRGFYVFLRKQGKNSEEVQDIFEAIKKDTIYEITHDWEDAFIISRNRAEVLDDANEGVAFEIDLLNASASRPMFELWDEEFKFEDMCQERLEATADRNAGKNTDEYWALAHQHINLMDSVLTTLEARYPNGEQASSDDKEFLNYLTFKLRRMRGIYRPWEETKVRKEGKVKVVTQTMRSHLKDGVWISSSMWKGMQNRINRLLHLDKRYPMKITREAEDEVMEIPGLIVYGLDIDRCIADLDESDTEQEE